MNAVIVFAKYPRNGEVKTRLGETLGDEFAARLYRLMAEYTFDVCLSLPEKDYDVHLYYDNEGQKEPFQKWIPPEFALHLQVGIDLGDRMKTAFNQLFNKGYSKILIIGTDCPQINANIIVKAFEELSVNDVVIGPSTDGGYYMLGMKKQYPFLFDKIKWSSEAVFSITVEKANDNKLSLYILPELIDIDTEADLKTWLMTFN